MSIQSWQDRLIYFVMIDRFFNGDPSNDDFGKGEYHPENDDCFKGGDLRGIIQKLPHIRDLGFDAIWITPPVHNQWINPYVPVRGYHGYWAYDFTRIDPHFGTLEDYRELVGKAHELGIKVIQDIVVNHTGNYFTVDEKEFDPQRPELNWKALADSYPPESRPKAPNDPVFCMNNPNVPEHKAAAVYNFTPNISDFKSRQQTLEWTMGDLDDINLRSPLAADRLREIYRYWIEQAGVDAFRVDTVYYTPEEFYEGFLHDEDPKNPGVKRFARQRGKPDFFVFGEIWSYDYRAINRYLADGEVRRLDSAIDLPLNEALSQVFYRKAPTETLLEPLTAQRCERNLWVNFLDNHDVERMNSRAGWPAVKQSLVALFTLPGIPCVCYGTEAGFTLSRQTMFREECYDKTSKHYLFLKKLIDLRKSLPALRRGRLKVLRTAPSCGILSYEMSLEDESVLVVFNTAAEPVFYDLSGEPGGFKTLLASPKAKTYPGQGGWFLPPESYLVLRRKERRAAPRASDAEPPIRLEPFPERPLRGEIEVRFQVEDPSAVENLRLLSNEGCGRSLAVADPASGTFRFDAAELGNGTHRLSLLGRTRSGVWACSNGAVVNVGNPFRLLTTAQVEAENKGGLRRKLNPPADPSYNGQLSMESVSVYTSGRDLRLSVRMANVTTDWNPPNGYDHVYFNVFFDFPGQRGKRYFPKLGYGRKDFEFNAGFLLYGWGSRSFGAKDSTRSAYGAPLAGEVAQEADPRERTVAFTFSRRFFDSLDSLSGVKAFVSTWDGYLGEFRSISDQKEDWNFYAFGRKGAADLPKVFDHVIVQL